MTREEMDFIGGMNMCDEISNEAYKKIMCHCEEQEPCEDCISRTTLLARIDDERKHLLDLKMDGAEHILVHHARRIIEDMPSVTPKAEWIPVTEKLPEKSGKYLVTVKNGNVYAGTYDAFSGKFQCAATAWQLLPEPYRHEENLK